MKIAEICSLAPVIPVIVIEDSAHAVPLARALVAGGLRVLEVTLRTPAALDAIGAMVEAVPEAVVGTGTLVSPADVTAAKAAGACFGVSPGATNRLLDAAANADLPMLPGVATPGEAMAMAEHGFDILKFFPAEQNGGASALKAWSAPLPHIRFCPTGGVSPTNAMAYLSLPNVVCVGGSWVCPSAVMQAGRWNEITSLAKEAVALRP